ncbi:MAG: hypothetical protein FWE07_05660 [Turicibacter sp.]|nr:hypothetical protein [Turicibacter sp.]
MFKPRQPRPPRPSRNQPQNPISDMEQFYMNQYFQTRGSHPTSGPTLPPEAGLHHSRFPPVEFAYLNHLEQRIAQIEQYLGFSSEPGHDTSQR